MTDARLDARLSAYLEVEERDRTQKLEREEKLLTAIAHVAEAQKLADHKFDLHALKVESAHAGFHARIATLEQDSEDTGITNIATLRDKVKEEREAKGRLLGWIIAAMGASGVLLAGAAGTVIWYLMTRVPIVIPQSH